MKPSKSIYCGVFSLVFACTLAGTVGCGVTNSNDKKIQLNPKLKRLLYWGYTEPSNYLPNTGSPAPSFIQLPIWVTVTQLYVNTWVLKNNVAQKGIFEITIDHNTNQFQSYSVFELPNTIYSLGYDLNSGRVFAVYNNDNGREVAYVSLAGNQATVEDKIVGADWLPQGVIPRPGKSGFIFYGVNPITGVAGFYWNLKVTNIDTDSLLYAISLDQGDANAFSITADGKYLLFSENVGSQYDPQLQFFKLDLSQTSQNPQSIVVRRGSALAISPNPIDTSLVLLNYFFGGDAENPPQAHIELLNLETSTEIDLDVRTSSLESQFIINSNPSWSPDGRNFAFAAGKASGEGNSGVLNEIWIYENVP